MRSFCIFVICLLLPYIPVSAQTQLASKSPREANANSIALPKQILRTGVVLRARGVSPNTIQLAKIIGIDSLLERIQNLSEQANDKEVTLASLGVRQNLWDARQQALLLIQKANMEVEYTIAEIEAEHSLYQEMLATFTNDRDKLVARINAISFITNGSLWAIGEALDIPSYARPRYSVSSGSVGILAGIIPSVASMYTLKAINGKKKDSEVEPNMLAKLFGYPANPEIDYPNTVWRYLHQVPADQSEGKTRLDQIIDRWVSDSNIPSFTDRTSRKQLDVITASVSQRKGLSIGTLGARENMLQQLHMEIAKIKRMLLELIMVVQGEKQFVSNSAEEENMSK